MLSLLPPLTHLSHQGFQTSQKLWQDRQKLLLAFLQERKPSSFAHHKRCAKQQHLSLTTLLLLYLAPLLPTYSYFFNYWSCQIIKEKLLSWNNFKLSLSSESLTLLHKNGRRLRWSSSKKKTRNPTRHRLTWHQKKHRKVGMEKKTSKNSKQFGFSGKYAWLK